MGKVTKIWIFLLVALVIAQMAMSLLMPRGDALTIASDLIQGALLLVATAAFLPNIARSRCATLNTRLFWILMGLGMLLRLTYQGMWNYFEVIKRQDVPDPYVGDIVLFLHLVPMIAALAVLPHLREDERDQRIRLLDFALLLTWWVFVYIYSVIPWQIREIDALTCSSNFNTAYLIEKLVLLIALAGLAYTANGGWRQLYGQLLGATALYASSSYLANWAISHKLYYSGSFYDIPLVLSIAWMTTVPVFAYRLDLSNSQPSRPLLGIWMTRLSMLALFSLLWAAMQAEIDPSLPLSVKEFRITASLLTMVVMGVFVFWRQRLLREEFSVFLERSRRALDDLKALQHQLIQSEKLASVGQLVGGAAHEINNPLTAMLGYSDLLTASNLSSEEKQQAMRIGEEVRRTTTLVASLLTFARHSPAQLAAVDIASLLQTSARLLSPRLDVEGTSIRLDLPSSLPHVLADSNQILHVCMHLTGQLNARLDSTCRVLIIRAEKNDTHVLIYFAPEHAGFGGDSHSEPPYLDCASHSGKAGTMSLSLSACRRIVEEHGGLLLQASGAASLGFRMELRVAASGAGNSLL